MLKVRWSVSAGGGREAERTIPAVHVEAVGGEGSATYLAFLDKNESLLLLIPGNRLIHAEEIAE